MRYVRPDFYDEFKCIADKCRHTCCIGWEIDVDTDSLDYYMELEGEIGRQLRESISMEPEPHFCLCEGERCPFLEKSGLCKLINELGEESLCDICAEHPRFYNCFEDREEAGLGLCCEETVRLLYAREGALGLISDGGVESVDERTRNAVFTALYNEGVPLEKCFADAMGILGRPLKKHSLSKWADFLLELERMDESWTDKLLILKQHADAVDLAEALVNSRYRRLCQYLVYRHLLTAEDYSAVLEFCVLATELIAALDHICGFDMEHTRLFSSEIEYSDENIELIIEEILRNR